MRKKLTLKYLTSVSAVLITCVLTGSIAVFADVNLDLPERNTEVFASPSNAEKAEDVETDIETDEIIDEEAFDDLIASPSNAEPVEEDPLEEELLMTELNPLEDVELSGHYEVDAITGFIFDGSGTGALVLPHKNYEFTYTLEDGILHMNFEDSAARDASFEIDWAENSVRFTDLDGVTNESYILNKVSE